VISMLLCMAVDPEPPSDRDLRQKSGGGVPGVIGRLLLLVNSSGKRYGELAEGTHTIIMEKNRLELFQAMQAFLDGERGW
jgi:hypothetical protein